MPSKADAYAQHKNGKLINW